MVSKTSKSLLASLKGFPMLSKTATSDSTWLWNELCLTLHLLLMREIRPFTLLCLDGVLAGSNVLWYSEFGFPMCVGPVSLYPLCNGQLWLIKCHDKNLPRVQNCTDLWLPSPIQTLWVNLCAYLFIFRTPRGSRIRAHCLDCPIRIKSLSYVTRSPPFAAILFWAPACGR